MTSQRQDPSDFLKQIIGRPVVVKLNSGVDYRGMFLNLLVCLFCSVFIYLFILKTTFNNV